VSGGTWNDSNPKALDLSCGMNWPQVRAFDEKLWPGGAEILAFDDWHRSSALGEEAELQNPFAGKHRPEPKRSQKPKRPQARITRSARLQLF
jgi:hypothetical protein